MKDHQRTFDQITKKQKAITDYPTAKPKPSNRLVEKDPSQQPEKIVDWWVRYFQKMIPFKVTWNWKSEAHGMTDGLCYRDKREVRFRRSSVVRWLKQGKVIEVRNLVAHEMAHFLHEDSAHKSGKFGDLKKRWNFKE